ncbi:MAG TPA: N-acetylmuramoyl-L-alanine amidase [Verrucomicrobiae bacterium]|nr:N-acetylmuramoyl-L-alanine amidase [Verrucomicrobiae bacterium]
MLIDNEPFMDAVDVRKTLEPLMLVAPLAFSNTPTIVVDPGHGGENAGTRSADGAHFEKEFTLDWALRLKPLLESNGWRVFLTRTNDADLSLSNRVAFAEARHADMFVSLHFNSAGGGQTQAGLETYCLTPAGLPSNLTRGYADDPAMVFPNNAFDAANVRLAFEIHRALLEMNGHRDRGIRRARFLGVLRNQKRPAILIEGGYLSNPEEAEQIADPEYRQRLAEAVAQALGGMLPAEGKPDRVQEGNSQSAGEGASEAAETQ